MGIWTIDSATFMAASGEFPRGSASSEPLPVRANDRNAAQKIRFTGISSRFYQTRAATSK
jgi:hypothetical protein